MTSPAPSSSQSRPTLDGLKTQLEDTNRLISITEVREWRTESSVPYTSIPLRFPIQMFKSKFLLPNNAEDFGTHTTTIRLYKDMDKQNTYHKNAITEIECLFMVDPCTE